MNTYDEWTLCKDCIYFEDCDTKEDRFGCYCGEPEFPLDWEEHNNEK